MSQVIIYYGIVGNPNGERVDVVEVERGARKRERVVATHPGQEEAAEDMRRRNSDVLITRAVDRMVDRGMTEAEARRVALNTYGA